MPGDGQRGSEFGAPAAQLGAVLRRKALTPRRAAVIIGGYTALVTFGGALVAWLADRKSFDGFGDAGGGRCRRSPPSGTAMSSRAAGPAV